jgi:hypothetical protein
VPLPDRVGGASTSRPVVGRGPTPNRVLVAEILRTFSVGHSDTRTLGRLAVDPTSGAGRLSARLSGNRNRLLGSFESDEPFSVGDCGWIVGGYLTVKVVCMPWAK